MIIKGDTERNSVKITDPGTTSHTFGGLERDTNYAMKMFARNAEFEYIKLIYTFFSERYGDKRYYIKLLQKDLSKLQQNT